MPISEISEFLKKVLRQMANPAVQGFIMGLAAGTVACRLVQFSTKNVVGAAVGLVLLGFITKNIIEG